MCDQLGYQIPMVIGIAAISLAVLALAFGSFAILIDDIVQSLTRRQQRRELAQRAGRRLRHTQSPE